MSHLELKWRVSLNDFWLKSINNHFALSNEQESVLTLCWDLCLLEYFWVIKLWIISFTVSIALFCAIFFWTTLLERLANGKLNMKRIKNILIIGWGKLNSLFVYFNFNKFKKPTSNSFYSIAIVFKLLS